MRLGTRASPLAIAQASQVAQALRRSTPGLHVELVRIRTHGDEEARGKSPPDLNGKALFTQRIEEALVAGEIHFAVHSLKDLPTESLPGVGLAAVPPRESPFDVLVGKQHVGLDSLPEGACVATGSLRRQAQLLHARPDLRIEPLSGNVDTRLLKLHSQGLDAIVLAAAGLRRLGLEPPNTDTLSERVVLPAPGQGALAIQALPRTPSFAIAERINDPITRAAVEAERAFSAELGGDCNTPVAALGAVAGPRLHLTGLVAEPDGHHVIRDHLVGTVTQPRETGRHLAHRLLEQGAKKILEALA